MSTAGQVGLPCKRSVLWSKQSTCQYIPHPETTAFHLFGPCVKTSTCLCLSQERQRKGDDPEHLKSFLISLCLCRKRDEETKGTKSTRWCHLLNRALGEPQHLSAFFFFLAHSHFQSHMNRDIQHRCSNIQPLLSPLYHLWWQSHAKRHSSYAFVPAGQPSNYKTCPFCRFHPISSSMLQENGGG